MSQIPGFAAVYRNHINVVVFVAAAILVIDNRGIVVGEPSGGLAVVALDELARGGAVNIHDPEVWTARSVADISQEPAIAGMRDGCNAGCREQRFHGEWSTRRTWRLMRR